MNPLTFWLILGVVLILLELMLPGLITVFFGVSALLVAAAVWLGLLQSWMAMVVWWVVLSMTLVLTIRSVLTRYIKGDLEKGNIDEDSEAYGLEVDVIEAFEPDQMKGRIQFRGTHWDAESLGGQLRPGGRARLLSRDNLRWIVEPIEGEEN